MHTTGRSGRRASKNLNRSFVDVAVPNPAYWRMVHNLPRYIVG